MTASDLFRPRLDSMIDLRHPLAILANQMPWNQIETGQIGRFRKAIGIELKQTFAKEVKELRRKAGGDAHAKQLRRLSRTTKRQRTIVSKLIREIEPKLCQVEQATPQALHGLRTLLARAAQIKDQHRKDKNKLYALHAPEVECKGKARQPYEFGVKRLP